jgi:hypothetical protein
MTSLRVILPRKQSFPSGPAEAGAEGVFFAADEDDEEEAAGSVFTAMSSSAGGTSTETRFCMKQATIPEVTCR